MFYHHNFTRCPLTGPRNAVDNSEVVVETFRLNSYFSQVTAFTRASVSYPQGCAPLVDRTQPGSYPHLWIKLWNMR